MVKYKGAGPGGIPSAGKSKRFLNVTIVNPRIRSGYSSKRSVVIGGGLAIYELISFGVSKILDRTSSGSN